MRSGRESKSAWKKAVLFVPEWPLPAAAQAVTGAVEGAQNSMRDRPETALGAEGNTPETRDVQAERNIRAVPGTIQAAPGAIPASTLGEPALSGNRAPSGDRVPGNWPVQGDVVSSYGRQGNDAWNTGVDLAAAPLSPVTAPISGTVSFVGEKDGKGHMVLAHENGLTSHYTNVTSTLVPGDAVPAGMVFAKVSSGNGFSGAETAGAASRVHFEIRRGELAINPESLLA